MKVDWKGLLQGMYNSKLGKKWIKRLAAFRYDTFCKPCEYNSKNVTENTGFSSIRPDEHCMHCGCNLQWKTHQLSSSCPKGLWQAEVTEQEAAGIDQIVK